MNEGMKRLLKCDSRCLLKDLCSMAQVMILLILWFWFIYGKVMNIMFALVAFMGLQMINSGVKDWQNQIRTYIGMGITRKTTFQVLVIRGLLQSVLGVLLEMLISAVFYREYLKAEILLVSLFLFLFCNGWGQLSGTVAVCWKYGRAVQIIGFMIVGALIGFGCMMAMYKNVLDEIAKWLNTPIVIGLGAVCGIVWIVGTVLANQQLKKFTVV